MKDIAKASRVNTALQVFQHMNDGKTVVAACKEVGIPRSTFYDVVNSAPSVERAKILPAVQPVPWGFRYPIRGINYRD